MVNLIIYLAVIWAVYQVYLRLFKPSKTSGCDKCAQKLNK